MKSRSASGRDWSPAYPAPRPADGSDDRPSPFGVSLPLPAPQSCDPRVLRVVRPHGSAPGVDGRPYQGIVLQRVVKGRIGRYADELGHMVDRAERALSDDDIAKIAGTYHAWRGDKDAGKYADVAGFCKSVDVEVIHQNGHILTPGRYVGAAMIEDDVEGLDAKMLRLATTLRVQQTEAAKLDGAINENLRQLGYGS